jgi:hypothetical protein
VSFFLYRILLFKLPFDTLWPNRPAGRLNAELYRTDGEIESWYFLIGKQVHPAAGKNV